MDLQGFTGSFIQIYLDDIHARLLLKLGMLCQIPFGSPNGSTLLVSVNKGRRAPGKEQIGIAGSGLDLCKYHIVTIGCNEIDFVVGLSTIRFQDSKALLF